MHRMNHPDGKRLLARVRGRDFAHAGEEEAIQLTWEKLPKNPAHLCLDAGCGRGGTAAAIQNWGWGQVTGIDIDETSIAEAQVSYPDVTFQASDIARVGEILPETFDVIYAFNAVYAFPDQAAALRSLRRAGKAHGRLAIFDYIDRGTFREGEFFQKPETHLWQPLVPDKLPGLLENAGWRLTEYREINEDYRRWYAGLVERFDRQREELLREFSEELVNYASDYYRLMFSAVERGELGGAIVYASAA